MTYNWKHISRTEASFMKGIAMLMILFHNFCHLIKPWNGENEFSFSYESTLFFIDLIKKNPENIVQYLFSFMGHYGVQLFVFLSGYGLFTVWQNREVKWLQFMKQRLIKLYPAYLVTVLVYLLILTIKTGGLPSWVLLRLAIADLLFIQSFVPGEAFRLVGPWWFFPMIVQLYMVFPLVMAAYRRWGLQALYLIGALAWLITLIVNPLLDHDKYNLNYFFIGHLAVFCLGMVLAGKETFQIRYSVIILAFIILIAGNLFSYVWPLTMLAAALLLSVLTRTLQHALTGYRRQRLWIKGIGAHSLFIFLVHGFLRDPFVAIAQRHNNPFITALAAIIFLVVTLIVARLIKKIQTPLGRAAEKLLKESKSMAEDPL